MSVKIAGIGPGVNGQFNAISGGLQPKFGGHFARAADPALSYGLTLAVWPHAHPRRTDGTQNQLLRTSPTGSQVLVGQRLDKTTPD